MNEKTDATRIVETIESALLGKREAVEFALCAFLSGGHLLIEDVPGVGKTTLAKAMVKSFGGTFSRVQFTSDLLPSDITGISVWNSKENRFEFKDGPIFSNLLLADEINRASPKTQSALLEGMSERQVTIEGKAKKLPTPFMVIATQNARDNFGTYPLPESQLDRFIMRINIGYTDTDTEKAIIGRKAPVEPVEEMTSVLSKEGMLNLISLVDTVRVDESIVDYIMRIISKTRNSSMLKLGAGPRGGMALHRCSRALAIIKSRDYVLPDDVKRLAKPVLAHRVVLEKAGMDRKINPGATAIQNILDEIEIPL